MLVKRAGFALKSNLKRFRWLNWLSAEVEDRLLNPFSIGFFEDLFPSQALDRVEAGGAPGGVEAEEDSDASGEGEGNQDGARGDHNGPVVDAGDDVGGADAEGNSNQSAGTGEGYGFG